MRLETKTRTMNRPLAAVPWVFFLVSVFCGASNGLAANKDYCVKVDYSAVPALVNDRKITLSVNVGSCASVSVTADGSPVTASYNSSTGTATFTTTGSSIVVTAVNWTSGGTGAAAKDTLYNNYHWAYSLTFDDNRQSQYDNGKPVLDAHGWRAGCAVVGSWANGGGGGGYYMSWATLQSLRAAGWDMFNHSYNHPNPLTCNNTTTDIGTELSQNQTLLQSHFPGYNVSHLVFPYENSTANTCAGFPPSFLLSSECGGGSYNFVDTTLAFQAQRGGLFGTDDTAWKTLAASAAGNSRPTWLIEYTHSVSAGSGATADQYSTNAATLGDLLNYLDTNFGSSGNKSLWFAPAGEVRDYLYTRDNAVVSTCAVVTATSTTAPTPSSTPTPTPTSSATATSTSTVQVTATPSPANTGTASASPTKTATNSPTATNSMTAISSSTASRTPTDTPTASATPTSTSTKNLTATSTATASATNTAVHTATPTATSSDTSTASFTATETSTLTFTPTPVNTATRPSTSTSTATPTTTERFTPTASSTTTPTLSSTATRTFTGTFSPTGTFTNTPTVTPTITATRTLVPPTNTSTATSASTATDSMTPSATASHTLTATPSSTTSWTPTASFTATGTASLTVTPSPTNTGTASASPTSTATNTATITPTPMPVPPTATPTSAGNLVVVIYPNPATGPMVNILPPVYQGLEDVRMVLFTASFRKVVDKTFPNVPGGMAVTLDLRNRWDVMLANGVYYVMVIIDGRRSIGRLLILR